MLITYNQMRAIREAGSRDTWRFLHLSKTKQCIKLWTADTNCRKLYKKTKAARAAAFEAAQLKAKRQNYKIYIDDPLRDAMVADGLIDVDCGTCYGCRTMKTACEGV